MRGRIVATAFLLVLAAAPASAAGSTLTLTGPNAIAFSDPVTMPVRGTLVLDGVACREDALIPVTLSVVAASAVEAAFVTDTFIARVPAGMEIEPREFSEALTLRLVPIAPGEGTVDVAASFALPPACIAIGGPTHGEATLRIAVTVRGAAQESALIDDGPAPPTAFGRDVPVPIVLCGIAALASAIAITHQRVRERRSSF